MDFCVKDVPVSHEYDVLVAGSGMGRIAMAAATLYLEMINRKEWR